MTMYYPVAGTSYIQTPSFAIPNTGILTIEAWMKSVVNGTSDQIIIGEGAQASTIGFILFYRLANTNTFWYKYANNTIIVTEGVSHFFLDLDNQWMHIVTVWDYTNKTLKLYRNGVQFTATIQLSGTPLFPLTNRVKYVGAYSPTVAKIIDGSLDEVRIYNRGLSADEVMSRYNKTRGRYQ